MEGAFAVRICTAKDILSLCRAHTHGKGTTWWWPGMCWQGLCRAGGGEAHGKEWAFAVRVEWRRTAKNLVTAEKLGARQR